MSHCGNKDLGNSVRAFLSCGALCILTSSYIKDIMEGLSFIENGKIPQERKSTCFQVAFYTFIFVLIITSTLTSIVFCLLRHNQEKTLTKDCFFPQSPRLCWAHGTLKGLSKPNFPNIMSWKWELKNCSGFVEEDNEQFLIIKQSGMYSVYAQVYRMKGTKDVFTLKLYKEPNVTLDQALGPKEGNGSGIINFSRPFFLNKGDRLYCSSNFELDEVVTGNLSYWGLYNI